MQDSEVVHRSPRIPNSGEKERTDRGLATRMLQERRRNRGRFARAIVEATLTVNGDKTTKKKHVISR